MSLLLLAHAEVSAEDTHTTTAPADTHAEEASGIGALGVNPGAFLIQLISFAIVIMLLQKFAFKPIIRLLQERRQVIEDGVKMGLTMEKEKAKFDKKLDGVMRDARHDADKIIVNANKEAREILRDAEKSAQRKVDTMIADAEARIEEDMRQAKRRLEKDIVGMVSDATEAIVEEKVDPAKDAKLIDKALKGKK